MNSYRSIITLVLVVVILLIAASCVSCAITYTDEPNVEIKIEQPQR